MTEFRKLYLDLKERYEREYGNAVVRISSLQSDVLESHAARDTLQAELQQLMGESTTIIKCLRSRARGREDWRNACTLVRKTVEVRQNPGKHWRQPPPAPAPASATSPKGIPGLPPSARGLHLQTTAQVPRARGWAQRLPWGLRAVRPGPPFARPLEAQRLTGAVGSPAGDRAVQHAAVPGGVPCGYQLPCPRERRQQTPPRGGGQVWLANLHNPQNPSNHIRAYWWESTNSSHPPAAVGLDAMVITSLGALPTLC
eukprot:5471261-Pyramimonas_sp.AAC.1